MAGEDIIAYINNVHYFIMVKVLHQLSIIIISPNYKSAFSLSHKQSGLVIITDSFSLSQQRQRKNPVRVVMSAFIIMPVYIKY